MTDFISDAARNRRESARVQGGRFGEQQHSAPETSLPEPSARDERLADLRARFDSVHTEWKAAQAALLAEHVSAVWEHVPLHAERVQFNIAEHGGEGLWFRGVFDSNGQWIFVDSKDHHDGAEHYSAVAEWADENELTGGLERDGGYVALFVGKDATRDRIGALQAEWKDGTSGRSSRQIGDDIDIATTRYMGQVAAEKGFASVELDWDEEGRTGLKATAVTTTAGKRVKAGSGTLDDHEILWAAAQFGIPTPAMERTDGVAPFTLRFDAA
jgi:hypothetical protein